MSNVVPLKNSRDWKYHADRIAAAWGKQVESIIETGRGLIEAKEDPEMEHGSFEAMLQSKLPFDPSTARRLMRIARNSVLSKQGNCPVLPPHVRTLDELAKLPADVLIAKLKDGTINPKMDRGQAKALRPSDTVKEKPALDEAKRTKIVEAIRADPLANQRDAADELGVSLGTYQRTRNELIESGAIKRAPEILELRDLVSAIGAAANEEKLNKEKRKDLILELMDALGLAITDFFVEMKISKGK